MIKRIIFLAIFFSLSVFSARSQAAGVDDALNNAKKEGRLVMLELGSAYGGSLLFVYALGHCALIFIAGLSVGLTESIIGSRGVRNFSLFSKRLSGALLVLVGVYFGITNL